MASMCPDLKRLCTFQQNPLPNHLTLTLGNSPAKLVSAGFVRRCDAVNDEVVCDFCGIEYSEWSGESPYAVHRVLNEHCPFINAPASAASQIGKAEFHDHFSARTISSTTSTSSSTHTSITVSSSRSSSSAFIAALNCDNVSESRHFADSIDARDSDAYENKSRTSLRIENDEKIPIPESFHRVAFSSDESHQDLVREADSCASNSKESAADSVISDISQSACGILSNSNQQTGMPCVIGLPSGCTSGLRDLQKKYAFPFKPRIGGFEMLFASRRLKTFPPADQACKECKDLVELGFVFRPQSKDVQCVFCTLVLPFHELDPAVLHSEESAQCPQVVLIDVGNIPIKDEENIRLKHLQTQRLRRNKSPQLFTVLHPQYEDEKVRHSTFENWPPLTVTPGMLSSAGFFYTGFADRVTCYSCGIGLYKWQPTTDPWQQHALHMPTCLHLLAVKGQHFVQQAAAEVSVLTEAVPALNRSSDKSGLVVSPGRGVISPPGSMTLDMSAVTAALATSRFPTKEILIGTLRAADENFLAMCKQRESLFQKDTLLQQKDVIVQQIQEELQQFRQEFHHHRQEFQHQRQELQHQRQELQRKDLNLLAKDEELKRMKHQNQFMEKQKEEELKRTKHQKQFLEEQNESLRIQVAALKAERGNAGQQVASVQVTSQPQQEGAAFTCDIRCKVCLSAEASAIFQPCKHVTCCSRCADRLLMDRCPVCRAPILDVQPAYIA